MITVHYKPLEALRPIHITILAVAETTPSLHSIGETLGVPIMLLEHAADDLVAWQMVSVADQQLKLLERGVRCVAVWASTDRRGFWNIDNDDRWVLGKGVFSFRDPLKFLADAGLDPETGNILSEAEAIKTLKNYQRSVQLVEKEIQDESLRARIIETDHANGDLAELIESSLGRAKTRLHLNRLCRQAESAFEKISAEATQKTRRFSEFKRLLHQQKSSAEKSVNQSRETQGFTRMLLASWLNQREGFLREVAVAEPCALFIRSDQGDVSWIEDTPREMPSHQEFLPGKTQSVFDTVSNFIGSLFR